MEPIKLTIGTWGPENSGADPFGGPTKSWAVITRPDDRIEAEIEQRKKLTDATLAKIAKANKESVAAARARGEKNPEAWVIKAVSFHDADLWPDDASDEQVSEFIDWLKAKLKKYDLEVQCFTTNLFSHPVFRAGALTSFLGEVRDAAVVKACRGVRAAILLGAKNIIFWGGREGTEVYEQDPVTALDNFMRLSKIVVDYGFAMGYDGTFTFEPKFYEPRFDLYAGCSGDLGALISKYFSDGRYKGKVGINPEVPQHSAMINRSPVLEVAQCLASEHLISVIHFGGQRAGRMDSDFPPGFGGNIFDDFNIAKLLLAHIDEWGGVVEFDCRPLRTTTEPGQIVNFIKWCIYYWRILEKKVEICLNDPIMEKIEAELAADKSKADETIIYVTDEELIKAVENLADATPSLDVLSKLPTDISEAKACRLLQIIMGVEEEGAYVFEGQPWNN